MLSLLLAGCKSEYEFSKVSNADSVSLPTVDGGVASTDSTSDVAPPISAYSADYLMRLCMGVTRDSCPSNDVNEETGASCQDAADQTESFSLQTLMSWTNGNGMSGADIISGNLDLSAYVMYSENISDGADELEIIQNNYEVYVFPGNQYYPLISLYEPNEYINPGSLDFFPLLYCSATSTRSPQDDEQLFSYYAQMTYLFVAEGTNYIGRYITSKEDVAAADPSSTTENQLTWLSIMDGINLVNQYIYVTADIAPIDSTLMAEEAQNLYAGYSENITDLFETDPGVESGLHTGVFYFPSEN